MKKSFDFFKGDFLLPAQRKLVLCAELMCYTVIKKSREAGKIGRA